MPDIISKDDLARWLLAFVVIGLLGAFIFVLALKHTNLSENMSGIIEGSLMTLAGAVVNFYFGSSSGSKSKDAKTTQ